MATTYFLYRSTRKKSPLTIRLQAFDINGDKFQFETKTEIEVTQEYWLKTRHKKRNVSGKDKNLIADINKQLSAIEDYVLTAYKKEKPSPQRKDWLKHTVYAYHNPVEEQAKRSDLLTDCIQHIIDTASIREGNLHNFGLSKSRVNSYKNLLKIIKAYQGNKRPFRVGDVGVSFGKAFLNWMINKKLYSESYARKKIDDLKTVCRDAEIDGLPIDAKLGKVKGGKPVNDQILYLSPLELVKIEKANLVGEALQNARKWLLLGCNIGQRGGDLLGLTENNFVTRNGLEVIELKQQKTGKQVTIPILDETREIIKDGLPRPIAIQNFNNYIKDICRIAEIDEPTEGAKITMLDKEGNEIPKDSNGKYLEKGVKRKIKGVFPKYELMTSHVCRRSFASNLYGILPTPLIMQITAHSSERLLLQYIGKNSLDYAKQIADFYDLQKLRKKKESQLSIIKNTSLG